MYLIYMLCSMFLFSEWKCFAKFMWIAVLFVMYNLPEFSWKPFFHKRWDRQKEKHAPHCWEKALIWTVWYLVVWITSLFFFTVLWNISLTNAPVERSRIKLYGPKPLNLQSTSILCSTVYRYMAVFILFYTNFESHWLNLNALLSIYVILPCNLNVQYKYLFEKNKHKTKLNKFKINYQQS